MLCFIHVCAVSGAKLYTNIFSQVSICKRGVGSDYKDISYRQYVYGHTSVCSYVCAPTVYAHSSGMELNRPVLLPLQLVNI